MSNSSSVDSYNNDTSLTSSTGSLNFNQPIKFSREGSIKLFRTARFEILLFFSDGIVPAI